MDSIRSYGMEDLGLTKKKAMELLQELEAFGLLEKKRRGMDFRISCTLKTLCQNLIPEVTIPGLLHQKTNQIIPKGRQKKS